jgi:hypothetical protein
MDPGFGSFALKVADRLLGVKREAARGLIRASTVLVNPGCRPTGRAQDLPVQQFGQPGALLSEIVTLVEGPNTLRNRHFGHGMTAPFALRTYEVDFTYLACTVGIRSLRSETRFTGC